MYVPPLNRRKNEKDAMANIVIIPRQGKRTLHAAVSLALAASSLTASESKIDEGSHFGNKPKN